MEQTEGKMGVNEVKAMSTYKSYEFCYILEQRKGNGQRVNWSKGRGFCLKTRATGACLYADVNDPSRETADPGERRKT